MMQTKVELKREIRERILLAKRQKVTENNKIVLV